MEPINAVGAVATISETVSTEVSEYLGTCFAFRHPRYFLAASHCFGNRTADRLAIGFKPFTEGHHVDAIYRHPVSDICVLRLEADPPPTVEVFKEVESGYGMGQAFAAYGFSETLFDYVEDSSTTNTHRMFRGYMQRYFNFTRSRYSYFAGEMSIPTPRGLSGGPVFAITPGMPLLGMVTEELRTKTASTGSPSAGDIPVDIIYGVALMLDRVEDWVNEHIPFPEL